jgi:hypothetical protein
MRKTHFTDYTKAQAWADKNNLALEPIGTCWEEHTVASWKGEASRIELIVQDMEYSATDERGGFMVVSIACPEVVVWDGLRHDADYTLHPDFCTLTEARKGFDDLVKEAL